MKLSDASWLFSRQQVFEKSREAGVRRAESVSIRVVSDEVGLAIIQAQMHQTGVMLLVSIVVRIHIEVERIHQISTNIAGAGSILGRYRNSLAAISRETASHESRNPPVFLADRECGHLISILAELGILLLQELLSRLLLGLLLLGLLLLLGDHGIGRLVTSGTCAASIVRRRRGPASGAAFITRGFV